MPNWIIVIRDDFDVLQRRRRRSLLQDPIIALSLRFKVNFVRTAANAIRDCHKRCLVL